LREAVEMKKAVVSAVLAGTIVFAGASGTDAADAMPASLRAQFEKFLAEAHQIPADLRAQFDRFMIERTIAKFLNEREKTEPVAAATPTSVVRAVTATVEPISSDYSQLIRLAAAGPEFPVQEIAAAVRPLMPKPDCVLPISNTEPMASAPPTRTNKHFEIGDKLKLAFFENIEDVEKNKWGNAASTGFQQHPELTGDYSVQDDGTISVPVLGSFKIVDLTPQELQTQMAQAFNKALGRRGFVTIMSIERPPIYVLGPVKNPGSYSYSPGMTVLHAVTLAGGFPRQDTTEPWQKIEKVRETTKRYSTLETLSELLTREAVLTAERDHVQPVSPPKQLVDLVGATRAAAIIAIEQDRHGASVAAHNVRLQSATEAIKLAQQQVEMISTKKSVESMDANIGALKKRADGIEQLYHQGALNNNLLIESRSRVAEAERARQEIIIQLGQAKQQLVKAQEDRAKLEADRQAELDTQIMAIDHQIAETNRENMASEGVLGALQVQFTPPASAITYEIVRQTMKGPVAFTANGMSTLIPGDLVQVSTTDTHPEPTTPDQPNSRPVTTTPASTTACR
jgi:protein involved in polysaccharide export with SLBB domain